jgi:phage gpG-like protein
MARALPQATGLQIVGGLRSAKGLEVIFSPSLAIVAGRIDKLGLDIRSFKEPLTKAVKDVVIPSIQKNFEAGGRPKWQKLAPMTVERKGGDTTILRSSGALQRGMKSLNIWTIGKNYAVLQDLPDNIWYGKVHQAGLGNTSKALKIVGQKQTVKISDGGIPARPFVVLQKADERDITSIFRHWLDGRIRANMGRL